MDRIGRWRAPWHGERSRLALEKDIAMGGIFDIERHRHEPPQAPVALDVDIVHGVNQRRQEQPAGAGNAAADDRQPVDQREGLGNGVAGRFAEAAEGFYRGCPMAGCLPDADFIDRLRFRGLVRSRPGHLGINPADGADRTPFLGVDRRIELVPQEPASPATELSPISSSPSRTMPPPNPVPKRDAEEVLKTPRAACLFQQVVYVR